MCGLRPWEFDRLSIAEFNGMVEARIKREGEQFKQLHELLAWVTVHLMNATGNFEKPVTMDQIMGREKVESPAEFKKRLEAVKKAQEKAKRKKK